MRRPYTGILVLLCATGASGVRGRELIHEGTAAPSFELRDTKGAPCTSRDLAGRAALVVFARPEQERSVLALRDAMLIRRDLPGTEWELLTIVSGTFTDEAVGALLKGAGFGGRALKDTSMEVYGRYGVIVTPSTVIIGRDGKVAFSKAGYDFELETSARASLLLALGRITAQERDDMVKRGRIADAAPSKVARLLGLAQTMRVRGELAGAEQLVAQALAEAPDSLPAHVELAEIRLAQHKPAEAFKTLQEISPKIQPSGPYHLTRGRALFALDKLDEAEREFNDAVKLDPRSGRAHYELGKLYERRGKLELAVKELKQAVEKLLAREP